MLQVLLTQHIVLGVMNYLAAMDKFISFSPGNCHPRPSWSVPAASWDGANCLFMKHLGAQSTHRLHWKGDSWFLSWSTHSPAVFIPSNVTKETQQTLLQFLTSSWDSDSCRLIYTPPLTHGIYSVLIFRNTVEKCGPSTNETNLFRLLFLEATKAQLTFCAVTLKL